MARIRTFLNGGSVLPGDLNAMQDDYEPVYSTYKPAIPQHGVLWAGGLFEYALAEGANFPQAAGFSGTIPVTSAGGGQGAFWLDPADFAASSTAVTRTVKLRCRVAMAVNAGGASPACVVAMKPITAVGSTGDKTMSYTVGAAVTGTSFTFAQGAVAAGATSTQTSADLTFPAAGLYVWTANFAGATFLGGIALRVSTLYRAV